MKWVFSGLSDSFLIRCGIPRTSKDLLGNSHRVKLSSRFNCNVGDLNNLRNEIWCILGIYLSSGSPKSVPRPFYDFACGELGGYSADAEKLEQLNHKMEDLF